MPDPFGPSPSHSGPSPRPAGPARVTPALEPVQPTRPASPPPITPVRLRPEPARGETPPGDEASRRGRPAIIATPAMPASVFSEIGRIGAVAQVARRAYDWRPRGARWDWWSAGRTLAGLPRPALAGDTQFGNAAAAIAALDASVFRVPHEAVAQGLAQVRLPGRFQVVPGEVEWILDVAHNVPAATELAHNLAARPAQGRTLAVAGFLDDKDVAGIGNALRGRFDEWFLATLPPPRGLEARQGADRLAPGDVPLATCGSVAEACARARAAARPGDRVVAFGSFHVVGPALEWLGLY